MRGLVAARHEGTAGVLQQHALLEPVDEGRRQCGVERVAHQPRVTVALGGREECGRRLRRLGGHRQHLLGAEHCDLLGVDGVVEPALGPVLGPTRWGQRSIERIRVPAATPAV
ncbi:hypothetical protein GCM10028802_21500 [Terrabacter terrigena]